MKDTAFKPEKMSVKQQAWNDSPCADCFDTPCCGALPLTTIPVQTSYDFFGMLVLSFFPNVQVCLKRSLEWVVFLQQNCRFLQKQSGKCSIHAQADQSLICKSYDAGACWYKQAFGSRQNGKMVHMDTARLLMLYEHLKTNGMGFDEYELDWEQLCASMEKTGFSQTKSLNSRVTIKKPTLSFSSCRPEQFLVLPPLEKPRHRDHFQLIRFKLGFEGMHLGVCDNQWAFILKGGINTQAFSAFTRSRYPGLKAAHNPCSFTAVNQGRPFYSNLGGRFVILGLNHLALLEAWTQFDPFGNVKALPSAEEALEIVRLAGPGKPGKAS